MSLVEFNVIRRDLRKNRPRLLEAFVLVGQANQNFVIPRLGNEATLPAWIGEVVQSLGLLFFLDLLRIPSADEENKIVGGPECPF